MPNELLAHKLWWFGPFWLTQPSPSWPAVTPSINPTLDLEEKTSPRNAATLRSINYWNLLDRYSTLSTLLHATVYLIRAISRFHNRSISFDASTLTPTELTNAENFWILHIQASYFASELSTLTNDKTLPKSHPFLRLAPFIDESGILRVGGRLRNALIEPDSKHPILLPKQSLLTSFILHNIHQRTLYDGVQLTLAVIRQKFCILSGRRPVSTFIRQYVRCCGFHANAAKELIGQLV